MEFRLHGGDHPVGSKHGSVSNSYESGSHLIHEAENANRGVVEVASEAPSGTENRHGTHKVGVELPVLKAAEATGMGAFGSFSVAEDRISNTNDDRKGAAGAAIELANASIETVELTKPEDIALCERIRQRRNPRFQAYETAEATAETAKDIHGRSAIQDPIPHEKVQLTRIAQISGSSIPAYDIAARQGPRLKDDLEELALELAKADKVIVDFNMLYLKFSDPNSAWSTRLEKLLIPSVALRRLRRVAMELPSCRQQLEACISGSQDFHRDYLSAKGLLEYWNIHRSVQKAMIDESTVKPGIMKADVGSMFGFKGNLLKQIYGATMNIANVALTPEGIINPQFEQLEATLQPLKRQLEAAIKHHLLTDEQKSLIGDRYTVLDDIFRSLESARSSRVFARKTPSWPRIAEQIGLSVTRKDSTDRTSFMMWATVIFSSIGSLPTFALGLKYSKPDPGKSDEADFWFLLQTCSTSLLSLLTLAISLQQNNILCGSNKIAAWGSIIVATSCVIAAPILYLSTPTAWGILMIIIAGIFQAWLVVHIAIEVQYQKSSKKGEDIKTD